MKKPLVDEHGRVHDYLRVSIIEKCNLRCRYCMPEDPEWTPKEDLCTTDELLELVDTFISLGVKKVRLTGGEPLVRHDVDIILKTLAERGVELAMTTNGILVDQYIALFEKCGLNRINVSLDTLKPNRFEMMTRRTGFEKVRANINKLLEREFELKVNAVIMRGVNDDELTDFVEWTRDIPLTVRFIEFMPFDGNRWDDNSMVPMAEIKDKIADKFMILRGKDGPNDTTKHYRVPGYKGQFGIISSMSEHFCGSCNRIRLLANGSMKNCLFSNDEVSLLQPLRQGEDLEPIIRDTILEKKPSHAGRFRIAEEKNRSMVTIGG